MNMAEKDQEIAERLKAMDELDQCSFLIEKGINWPETEGLCIQKNKIKGCQVNIWFRINEGKAEMYSDSFLTNGVLALFAEVCTCVPSAEGNLFLLTEKVLPDIINDDIRNNGLRKVQKMLCMWIGGRLCNI